MCNSFKRDTPQMASMWKKIMPLLSSHHGHQIRKSWNNLTDNFTVSYSQLHKMTIQFMDARMDARKNCYEPNKIELFTHKKYDRQNYLRCTFKSWVALKFSCYWCRITVWSRSPTDIFQTSSCTIMIQNESLKGFFSTSRRRVVWKSFGTWIFYKNKSLALISVQSYYLGSKLKSCCKMALCTDQAVNRKLKYW